MYGGMGNLKDENAIAEASQKAMLSVIVEQAKMVYPLKTEAEIKSAVDECTKNILDKLSEPKIQSGIVDCLKLKLSAETPKPEPVPEKPDNTLVYVGIGALVLVTWLLVK